MMNYMDTSSATSLANSAANNAYYRALAAGSTANTALQQAQFAWQQKMDEAQMTGQWNGQWSFPAETQFTNTFGTYFGNNTAPQQGAATLQMQQMYGQLAAPGTGASTLGGLQQQQDTSQLYGMYFAPGTAPAQGQQTLAAQQQAIQNAQNVAQLTGWYNAPGLGIGQGAGTGGQPGQASGSGYFVGNDGRIHQGNPNDQNQQGWGSAQGLPAAAGWTSGTTSSDPTVFMAPPSTASGGGGASAAGTSGGPGGAGSGGPGGQGTQTLAGQQQQWQQAFDTTQFQAQQAQLAQQNALAYLQQLANLRGPADWAKYQQVLGSTPGGMRDLYSAAMGQYIPGGGATTGQQPQAVDLNTMQQQIAGGGQSYAQNQGGYTNPQGGAPSWGSGYQTQQPSGQTWGSGIGVGPSGTSPQQLQQAQGGGTNMYGNLPAPNQISSQAWNNFTPSQQQLLLGQYEAQGYDKNDVQALYNQSLPKYANNSPGAGVWRLQ